jgi:hypothetical protein
MWYSKTLFATRFNLVYHGLLITVGIASYKMIESDEKMKSKK